MFDDEKSVFKTQPQAFVSFLIPRRPDIKKALGPKLNFSFSYSILILYFLLYSFFDLQTHILNPKALEISLVFYVAFRRISLQRKYRFYQTCFIKLLQELLYVQKFARFCKHLSFTSS